MNIKLKKKSQPQTPITIRPITQGPKYHWFGYYDKLQFHHTGRYVLAMQTDFQHRQPTPDDTIDVGVIDLHDHDKWIPLGQSRAWAWQNGCMLQWRPAHPNQILWNDRLDDQFVCHILDIQTGKKQTLPFPIFTVHPQGKIALGLDFHRLDALRPGYGYPGLPNPHHNQLAPDQAGVYLQNLQTAQQKLIISLAQIAKIPRPNQDLTTAKHYFNCLLFNPDGSRFVFLHRWRPDHGKGWPFRTRMFSAKPNGADLRVVHEFGCGHFIWRDNQHLLLQVDGFTLFSDGQGPIEKIGKDILPSSGGHISYLPGNQWLVGDTYADKKRNQHLYLYNLPQKRLVMLGSFHTPAEFAGQTPQACGEPWRCDLHPRFSPDGNSLTIDSPHAGNGRQIYLIDIKPIVNNQPKQNNKMDKISS